MPDPTELELVIAERDLLQQKLTAIQYELTQAQNSLLACRQYVVELETSVANREEE